MLNALILAGMQSIKDLDAGENKALLRINGRMMIDYVIAALRNTDSIGKIVVIGPGSQLEEALRDKADAVVDSNGTVMENVKAGVEYLGSTHPILICTSDIPMVTSEAINDFISRAEALQADFCYPIVDKKVNDMKYPEVERTYVNIKEGSFTGGNIFYINPEIIDKAVRIADKLIQARKNPIKMARLLSISFLVRLLTGTLTISTAEKKFSKITRIKARAVISEYPEIGNDVDKPSDVIVATAHLSK